MSLFSDIYNTVARFFRSQDEQLEDPSKSVAQNRLKLVLMQDRTNLTPKVLEQMRGEMIDLLSKYLEMDKDLLELNFEQDGSQVALMLSIPVIRAKDEEEIEAVLNKANEISEEIEESELEDTEEYEKTENSEIHETEDSESLNESSTKPHKRSSKKVSAPDELNGNDENNSENINSENTEQTKICDVSEN